MSSQTRSRAARSIDPCEPDGVPTQISETSVARTASAASWVARSRPDCGRLGDRLGQARLEDRRLAVVDRRDLARVDVHSDDVMAAPREAARRNGAHVAQPDDGDSHAAP